MYLMLLSLPDKSYQMLLLFRDLRSSGTVLITSGRGRSMKKSAMHKFLGIRLARKIGTLLGWKGSFPVH